MKRRLLVAIVTLVLIGIVVIPSVGYGQMKLNSSVVQNFLSSPPSASSRMNSLKDVVNACEGKVSSAKGWVSALSKEGASGVTEQFASNLLLPGSGIALGILGGGLKKLFGGGGDKAQTAKLDEICKTAKRELELLKKQERERKLAAAKKTAGAVAFKNALTIFLNRLAYRYAIQLGTKWTGQKPGFETDFDFQDEADAAVGEFLDQAFGKSGVWGKSLCEPFTPFARLNIQLTVRGFVQPQRPRCSASKIWKNIGGSFKNIKSLDDVIAFSDYFSPSGNDIGATLTLYTKIRIKAGEEKHKQEIRTIANQAFKDVVSPITNIVKTPAALIRRGAENFIIDQTTDPYLIYTGEAIADAVGVFTNTLAGKLIEDLLFKKGLNPSADSRSGNIFSLGISSVQAAAQRLVTIIQGPDLRIGGSVDILQNLTTPGGGAGSGEQGDQNECVIDEKFRLAIERKLTVKQALEGGYLAATRAFGSLANGQQKTATVCEFPDLYSLRSIMIMKKYRIVPEGWRLAAEYIANYASKTAGGKTFNLADLVKSYSDASSPFYRLVDQNWVLKAPQNFIRRKGYNPLLVPEDDSEPSIARDNIALDEQSCIKENKDGSCQWYGYCTEEKPMWDIPGTQCSPQNSSCRTLANSAGNTLSLLFNTTDRDPVCSQPGAVGCRRYCTVFNSVDGDFQCAPQDGMMYQTCTSSVGCACTIPGRTPGCTIANGGFGCTVPANPAQNLPAAKCTLLPTIPYSVPSSANGVPASVYVNKEADSCTASSAGCNEYLKLYDVQGKLLSGTGTGSVGEIISGAPAGANQSYYQSQALVKQVYLKGSAQSCENTDAAKGPPDLYAGCELYTPVQGGRSAAIPGIAGNVCDEECVGYRSYKEGFSYFDFGQGNSQPWPEFYPKPAPVNLIANAAQRCSAASAGCEEFTNLEAASSGGEAKVYFTYLRQCQKQGTGGSQAVFYTWEGTDTTGFQLKEWVLVADSGGNPQGTACTQADAELNPDCRQFYNTSAQTSWVLQSTTTFVSDDCKQYRRTKNPSEIWNAIASQSKRCSAGENMCLQYKGVNANNIRIVRLGNSPNGVETFDDGNTNGWSGGTISSESIVAGGRSMQISGPVRSTTVLGIKKGAVYELSLWMKGPTVIVASLENSRGESQSFMIQDQNIVANEWSFVRMSLLPSGYYEFDPDTDAGTYLQISGNAFIDTIVLRETPDSLFLIQNSWVGKVPAICAGDATQGIPAQLDCQAYTTSQGDKAYLRDFARLCPSEFIGCAAMVNTRNSDLIGSSPIFRGVSAPADSLAYVIDNPKNYCSSQEAGCARLGLDGISQSMAQKFTAKYLVLDPDQYQSILCESTQNYCEQWSEEGSLGGTFFKDPSSFMCEFKTNVVNSAGVLVHSGWFLKGTNIQCPPFAASANPDAVGHCFGGRSMAPGNAESNECTTNADCTNYYSPGQSGYCVSTPYAASCPSSESSCTELQDPQRPAGCDKTLLLGQSAAAKYPCDYYYYLKDSLETSGCTKQDVEDGCIGFFDTSSAATFSSQAQCLGGTSASEPCTDDSQCPEGRCGYP